MLVLGIPDSVLHSLKLQGKTLKQDLLKLLAVKLYDKGALGLGKTSELCGATRGGWACCGKIRDPVCSRTANDHR